jgi:hypothetical protein
LLDSVIALLLHEYRDQLTQGTVLIDDTDEGQDARVLFYLEHTIQDASTEATGKRHVISRQLQFIEINEHSEIHQAGYAPFLDYRPAQEEELAALTPLRHASWLSRDLEQRVRTHAITRLVPYHLLEVKKRREEQINKTYKAVNERLTNEIGYWDNRAEQLRMQERAGKVNAKINSQLARQRAEELLNRLEHRLNELEQERKLSALPPVMVGGVLVVPIGLLKALTGEEVPVASDVSSQERQRIELVAMAEVTRIEQEHGYEPRDVSAEKCGYDIESRVPDTGQLRFIEVKGRVEGAETVTVTQNEILTALNKPDDFVLALVEVDGAKTVTHYIIRPFSSKPDFEATSVNYNITKLLASKNIVRHTRVEEAF